MKVVLFCGGLGMRLREYSESIPKPMVPIGYRPVLWHVMKYYAHYGHKEFILCLGYKADAIKNYFLHYDECLSNNFVLSNGGRDLTLLNKDIDEWRITFVDTGLNSNIGQRLKAVEGFLGGEEIFLANYTDVLSDLPLEECIEYARGHNKIASFICVKPTQSFHVVSFGEENLVREIRHVGDSRMRINGGFFVFRKEIFQYIREGEDLIQEPFQRLIARRELLGYPYDGFWGCMDTFKERQTLEDMYTRGNPPWEVWKTAGRREIRRPEPGMEGVAR